MVKTYNLKFLCSLFLGVAISILSLARLISYLLEEYPIVVWSFFFGLVLASILYIAKQITKWSVSVIIAVIVGAAIAYYVTIATPSEAPDAWYFYLLSGGIAIIAMILPGISGSFILVLLGSYGLILGTITDAQDALVAKNWDLLKVSIFRILLFMLGCIVGLKIFSKVLRWMFDNKKEITLAVLTGFMIGSLNKIWPWKETISTDAQVLMAIVFSILGFALILLLEKTAKRNKTHNAN